MFELIDFCGGAFGITGKWGEKKIFSRRITCHKEKLNIARVPAMFSLFLFFRFNGCLLPLMEFCSIHIATLKPESTSKHYFDETLFLKELCHRPFLMAFL